MKIYYDEEVDALYVALSEYAPEGVTEIADEVNLDTTPDGKLVGIEILNASAKLDINTIWNYSLDLGNPSQPKRQTQTSC